ncbi:hypothetical protein ACSBOX_21395 (plasmid) [Arthrobacter sp. KN11-1C]|uniref:hypothetical protein n=1 Tax=Arthrobacter sp. KN11-1C TaxID=3445774 RepID=UPI003F9FEE0E
MPVDTITASYYETAQMDIHSTAKELNEALGPTLVAVLAGVRDRKLPSAWARGDVVPRDASVTKLKTALRVWRALKLEHDEHIARSWFIGLNPLLDETTPIEALNKGMNRQVIEAARAFLDDNIGS